MSQPNSEKANIWSDHERLSPDSEQIDTATMTGIPEMEG